jgi:hypothetical protein
VVFPQPSMPSNVISFPRLIASAHTRQELQPCVANV